MALAHTHEGSRVVLGLHSRGRGEQGCSGRPVIHLRVAGLLIGILGFGQGFGEWGSHACTMRGPTPWEVMLMFGRARAGVNTPAVTQGCALNNALLT